MAALAKQLLEAVCASCAPQETGILQSIAGLLAGLASVLRILQMQEDLPGHSQPLLFGFCASSSFHITQAAGALVSWDHTYFSSPQMLEAGLNADRLNQELQQLDAEIREWAGRTGQWLTHAPETTKVPADRLFLAAIHFLEQAAAKFDVPSLPLVVAALHHVRAAASDGDWMGDTPQPGEQGAVGAFVSSSTPEITPQDLSDG